MKNDTFDAFFLFWGVVTLAGAWGWVLNIIKLVVADAMNGMVVARAIGVVIPPLGAVLGVLS